MANIDVYIDLYIYTQDGLRRGGLTPALAPRVPVMAEDVGNRSRSCDSTAKNCIQKISA